MASGEGSASPGRKLMVKRKGVQHVSATTEKVRKLRNTCKSMLTRLKAKTYASKKQLTIEWFTIKKTKEDLVDAFNSWIAVIVYSDQLKLQSTNRAGLLRVLFDSNSEGVRNRVLWT